MPPEPGGGARTPAWLRWAAFVLALMFLVWLPLEDTDTTYVFSLAAALLLLLAAGAALHSEWGLVRTALVGLIAGLAVAPAAVLLMVFKGGLHAHGFPDFALRQLRAALLTSPWWGLGGLALGLLAGWFRQG